VLRVFGLRRQTDKSSGQISQPGYTKAMALATILSVLLRVQRKLQCIFKYI
jgi:hypothetical protein